MTNQAIAEHLYPKAAGSLVRDFDPVGLVANGAHMLNVHPSVPARTVSEFVAWLKANDGKVNYASQGNGTLSHLETELLSQRIGVLGLNGSGKSTLLKIMAGVDTDFIGEARPMPDLKIGYLSQEPELDPAKDVRGNVEDGLRVPLNALRGLESVYAAYAEENADFDALAKKQAELEDVIQAWDAHNLEHKMEIAADALRLPAWDADVTKLSGGERRRVALCRLLMSRPDVLLLDEPTNHLDAESVAWLEHFLKEFTGTVVAITHDRYFLDNAAGWILELDRGHGIPGEPQRNYGD